MDASSGYKGENNPHWKGDKVKYGGLHAWINKKLGQPNLCEKCGTTSSKKFEWASKSRTYKRDLNDWIRLCHPCHEKYDDGYKGAIKQYFPTYVQFRNK